MKKTSVKRIAAYIIDALILGLIISLISTTSYLKSKDTQATKLEKQISSYYEKYENEEITAKEYTDLTMDLTYKIQKYDNPSQILTIILYIAYFGIFQALNKGQTIGKMVMKIKIKGYQDKKINIFNYLLRCLFLYGVLTTAITIGLYYLLDVKTFFYASAYVSLAGTILVYIIIFMVLVKQDGRGLHDYLAKTEVIDTTVVPEEVKEEPKEKVIEADYEETKAPKKKTSSKKKNSSKKVTKKIK